MSWFWRGFQSAVFYYLSCAPCAKIAYQRRRRKGAHRAKSEKLPTELEQGVYRHPSPFSTNIYWNEEMAMGPGPPQKKGNRDRDKGKAESSRQLRSGGAGSSALTGTSSADTIVENESRNTEAGCEKQSSEGWNRRRYQREDEILWGIGGDSTSEVISRSGSASGSYYVARNPAVNDLHPPVVSTQPTHRNETKWMLQPPPSARIMEGKERVTRSRSGSGVSHQSDSSRKKDDMSLGRKVGERLMEEKVKRGVYPPESAWASNSMLQLPSRESARSEVSMQGQKHDRDPLSPITRASTVVQDSHHLQPQPPSHILSTALTVPRPALLSRNSSSSLPVFESTDTPSPSPNKKSPSPSRLNTSSAMGLPNDDVQMRGVGRWWPGVLRGEEHAGRQGGGMQEKIGTDGGELRGRWSMDI
ncbi:hypothetical protein MMC07_007284 [Pseudocyphellaria aurata]|nr:hypothetical protein [Pseudocyphellaria aurata]